MERPVGAGSRPRFKAPEWMDEGGQWADRRFSNRTPTEPLISTAVARVCSANDCPTVCEEGPLEPFVRGLWHSSRVLLWKGRWKAPIDNDLGTLVPTPPMPCIQARSDDLVA